MPEEHWVSAHIFYHDQLDPLLVELVRPLVEHLAATGLARRFFFLRYWEGGNHLRLRVEAPPDDHSEVQAVVRLWVEDYLRTHPAADRIDAAGYAAVAARYARQEGRHDYARSLYPNNSVRFIPYRRETARYGSGAAMEAVEQHFVESSQLALGVVAAGTPHRHRSALALSATLLSWLCAGWPVDTPMRTPARATGPGELERRYQRRAEALRQYVLRLQPLAAGRTGPVRDNLLTAWTRSLRALRDRFDPGHHARVVLDTCAHLFCNRVGVLGRDEATVRYLAARAMGEVLVPEGDRDGLV